MILKADAIDGLFDGLVLSKAYKVLDKQVQKSYVSWH